MQEEHKSEEVENKSEYSEGLRGILELLVTGLYNYLFFINPIEIDQQFNLQQYKHFIQFIVAGFSQLSGTGINNIDKLIWVVFHPHTGKTLEKQFFHILVNDKNKLLESTLEQLK